MVRSGQGLWPGEDMPDSIITDTATKIFQDLCEADTVNKAEKGEWPAALWDALEESGLPLTWVSDEFGGAGAELADGFAVLRGAGAARRDPARRLALGGGQDRRARRADDDRPGARGRQHQDRRQWQAFR